jgi:peptidoglycan/LPS O-acetylase OafA/YrhL
MMLGTFSNYSKTNQILAAFSIRKNFQHLTKTRETIEILNILKVISAIWIIIGHRVDMMIEHPSQAKQFMSFGGKMIIKVAEMFTSVVDTFFVVSGVLVTKKCLKMFEKKNFSFIRNCAPRFIRFTVSLAIIFMIFMSSLHKIFGHGPQLDELIAEVKDCKENWLPSLLLVGNLNEKIV